jgi:hypothetical protein
MRTWRMRTATVIGSLLVSPLAACTGAPASSTAAHQVVSTVSVTATTSLSPSFDPQAQDAISAYEAAWADAAAVEDGGNYRDPRLQRHIAGQLLLAVSENFYTEETHHIASRGAPILHPHVNAEHLSTKPPTIIIADCIDFRHFIQYYPATGKQYGPVQTGLSAATSTMTLMNGAWMATDDDVQQDGSCSL